MSPRNAHILLAREVRETMTMCRHQPEEDEAGRGETRHPQLPDPTLPRWA